MRWGDELPLNITVVVSTANTPAEMERWRVAVGRARSGLEHWNHEAWKRGGRAPGQAEEDRLVYWNLGLTSYRNDVVRRFSVPETLLTVSVTASSDGFPASVDAQGEGPVLTFDLTAVAAGILLALSAYPGAKEALVDLRRVLVGLRSLLKVGAIEVSSGLAAILAADALMETLYVIDVTLVRVEGPGPAGYRVILVSDGAAYAVQVATDGTVGRILEAPELAPEPEDVA